MFRLLSFFVIITTLAGCIGSPEPHKPIPHPDKRPKTTVVIRFQDPPQLSDLRREALDMFDPRTEGFLLVDPRPATANVITQVYIPKKDCCPPKKKKNCEVPEKVGFVY